MGTLIIGLGNSLRGDDGIGPALIKELARQDQPEVRLLALDTTGLDLIKHFQAEDRIIIVDAAEMGAEPGTIRIFSAEDLAKIHFNPITSTHGIGLPETIKLARLAGYKNEIQIIGVQGQTYSYHEGLSEKVMAAIPQIIEIIKRLK